MRVEVGVVRVEFGLRVGSGVLISIKSRRRVKVEVRVSARVEVRLEKRSKS